LQEEGIYSGAISEKTHVPLKELAEMGEAQLIAS
jgi:hypothetical protein